MVTGDTRDSRTNYPYKIPGPRGFFQAPELDSSTLYMMKNIVQTVSEPWSENGITVRGQSLTVVGWFKNGEK